MAVTKIHRISRLTLYSAIVITLVVLGLFYLGGNVPATEQVEAVVGKTQPVFMDVLLYWMYAILIITVVVWVVLILITSLTSFKESPKKSLGGLVALIAIAALLIITYMMGDGTLLHIPGYQGSDNQPGTLRMTDMWLYSMYIMFVLTILAMLVMPFVKRKK